LRSKLWKKSIWPCQSPTAAFFTHRDFTHKTFFAQKHKPFCTQTHMFLDFFAFKTVCVSTFFFAEEHVCYFYKEKKGSNFLTSKARWMEQNSSQIFIWIF
jgi:hypothetical protein